MHSPSAEPTTTPTAAPSALATTMPTPASSFSPDPAAPTAPPVSQAIADDGGGGNGDSGTATAVAVAVGVAAGVAVVVAVACRRRKDPHRAAHTTPRGDCVNPFFRPLSAAGTSIDGLAFPADTVVLSQFGTTYEIPVDGGGVSGYDTVLEPQYAVFASPERTSAPTMYDVPGPAHDVQYARADEPIGDNVTARSDAVPSTSLESRPPGLSPPLPTYDRFLSQAPSLAVERAVTSDPSPGGANLSLDEYLYVVGGDGNASIESPT
jgi:hypothetical protein